MGAHLEEERGFGGAQLPLEVFLVGLILVAAPYFITNNIAEAGGVTVLDPEMGFDRDIPVIYWTILLTPFSTLFYPVTLLVCPRDDRAGPADRWDARLITVTAFCCLIFLLLPRRDRYEGPDRLGRDERVGDCLVRIHPCLG